MFGHHVVLLALQKPGHRNIFTVVRPNTGGCTGLQAALVRLDKRVV